VLDDGSACVLPLASFSEPDSHLCRFHFRYRLRPDQRGVMAVRAVCVASGGAPAHSNTGVRGARGFARTSSSYRSAPDCFQILFVMMNLHALYALIKRSSIMPAGTAMLRRHLTSAQRNLRGAKEVLRALVSTDHPLLAHLIPVRRCNLACKYCNEFDDFSKPVPLDLMFARVDKLAELGTSVITISGGEPLLHPELDAIIARIRLRDMVAGMI